MIERIRLRVYYQGAQTGRVSTEGEGLLSWPDARNPQVSGGYRSCAQVRGPPGKPAPSPAPCGTRAARRGPRWTAVQPSPRPFPRPSQRPDPRLGSRLQKNAKDKRGQGNPQWGELVPRCKSLGGPRCADATNSRFLTSARIHGQQSRRGPILCNTLRPACTESPRERPAAPHLSFPESISGTRTFFFPLPSFTPSMRDFSKSPLKRVNLKLTLCWIRLFRPFMKAGRTVTEGSREGRKDPLVFLLLKS